MVFLSRALLQEVVCKRSTGLAGLKVCTRPKHILTFLYGKTLRALNKLPEDSAYKCHTEEIITWRLNIVKNAKTPEEVEEQIDCGQVEELIIQAENELALARKMLHWKPWEPLIEEAPPDQWKWPM
uniref:NADH dehydrogenase [ubiquinone] 1 alpha subcomplex subunit 5 n=2 Tax=Rhodnius prolixus TaxID=13249 RepID=T1HMR2_RHOPR